MSALPASQTAPHRFYYLDNFERALQWISQRYSELLSIDEAGFISGFASMSQPARALLVRLIMRRGVLFRRTKVEYAEIGSIENALRELEQRKWIDLDPVVSIGDMGRLFTKDYLASAFAIDRRQTKAELVEQLELAHPSPQAASHWVAFVPESVFQVTVASICERLRLLFFGNFYQDWKEFVLADLGIFKYEIVEISADERAFHSREQIEAFYRLAAARQALKDGHPLTAVLSLLPNGKLDHEWLQERRAKLLFEAARQYERASDYASALSLYDSCAYPGAVVRQVRILMKSKHPDEAQAIARRATARVTLRETERHALLRVIDQLDTRSGCGRRTRQINRWSEDSIEIASWERLERETAEHLASAMAPVFYVENALFNSLFGLCCWDAIFARVPGAFFHPFQRGPADLSAPGFLKRRAECFEKALTRLDAGEHPQHIMNIYKTKEGIQSPFVAWGALSEQLLSYALNCIPAQHLRLVFERLMQDLLEHTKGMPDLIQFYPAEKRYRLIEIKGPGDRLQTHQRRWMNFFADHQIPASVCHVRRKQQAA